MQRDLDLADTNHSRLCQHHWWNEDLDRVRELLQDSAH